ncbi:AAA family ATPase [Flavobacterium psychrophilum]|uniref:AAA family ATPase n=1 Tax=Flavobacterium psychrophilum TaxID=96345 RepID=UPI002909900C|nr:AAA family ATPase [Flavobacterium psychrophilum]
MKIQIKEIGAIKDATIDLSKKLNVFCGPNGTGKTYMAYIIYAITSLENKNIGIRFNNELINKLISEKQVLLSIDINEIWEYQQNEISQIRNNLWSLFALSETKQEQYFGKSAINFLKTEEDFKNRILKLEYNWNIKIDGYNFLIDKEKDSFDLKIAIPDILKRDESFFRYIDIVLMSRIYSLLSFFPITSSIFFPVERNSIFTFNNELSIRNNERYEMIQEMLLEKKDINPFQLLLNRKTRYPQAIKDALKIADDLEEYQKTQSSFYHFAEEIENKLLNGKVIISKEGNVEFKSNKAKSLSLSFHQSSSIVKTLASLILYLKHKAVENDLIIIDEPELNLHPDNQILLARIFSKLIKKGLRIIVSTHSDYIIREFNNILMISQDNNDVKELATQIGYEEDEIFEADDINMYLFDFKNDKSLKTEVKVLTKSISGFSIKSIDDAIEKQSKIADQIYYTLRFGKSE